MKVELFHPPFVVICLFVAEGYLMQYKQLYGCSISSIFNSDIYWDIREKLLDGSSSLKGRAEGANITVYSVDGRSAAGARSSR